MSNIEDYSDLGDVWLSLMMISEAGQAMRQRVIWLD
jgi:hypothetical protein